MQLSVNMAMTMDGKVMRPDGRWYGLTSAHDRATMDIYRSQSDALIVGRNSIENDNPVVRVKSGKSPRPVMICRGRLPSPDLRIFSEENPEKAILFVSEALLKEDKAVQLSDYHCEVEALSPAELEPGSVLERLANKGMKKVLLEGGPSLNYPFFAGDFVRTLYITIVPFIIGQSDLPAIVNGSSPFKDFQHRNWTLVRAEREGDEIFTEYRRS